MAEGNKPHRVLRYMGIGINGPAILDEAKRSPELFAAYAKEYVKWWESDPRREILVRRWCQDARLCWHCGGAITESTGVGLCPGCFAVWLVPRGGPRGDWWAHRADVEAAYRSWCADVRCCHLCHDLEDREPVGREGLCQGCLAERSKFERKMARADKLFSLGGLALCAVGLDRIEAVGGVYNWLSYRLELHFWTRFLKRRSPIRDLLRWPRGFRVRPPLRDGWEKRY